MISVISRRKLLSGLPALGAISMLPSVGGSDQEGAVSSQASSGIVPLLDGWQFRMDSSGAMPPPEAADDRGWQLLSIPHTWQRLGESPDYVGTAWYRRYFVAPEEWAAMFVRAEFEAVYHTAHVFLNGTPVGDHIGKGYTAFTCDLSPHMRHGQVNQLAVRVDNSFAENMLPRMKSFDWANDGGITRPVQLLVSSPVFIQQIAIEATPDLDANVAEISIKATIRNTTDVAQKATVSVELRESGGPALGEAASYAHFSVAAHSTQTVPIEGLHVRSPKLWHFDHPNLYRAEVTLDVAGREHTLGDTFGIRKFETRDTSFYLNGEKVSLIGVERMAGSNPDYGMAEPAEWIEANSRDMKDLNCVFSRVHWPQDRRILDFCDEHGILMQEEVPAWGPSTFENASSELLSQLTANGIEQLNEMIARDRNHPCIVSWGLCNEVNGKNPNSRAFAHALAGQARAIDPSRLLTYASHTLRANPAEDMAGDFDFISANEYFGSWYPGGSEEVMQFLRNIRQAFPGKPIVVSEYGWCECQPIIPPGDQNRVTVIEDHTRVFRESGMVAGAIYFDYNDYRTIVGDKGVGALRQRVHGVVNLYAQRKPSFDALRLESSPIEALVLTPADSLFTLEVQTRRALPAYTLRGYTVRWLFYGYDDLPIDGALESLAPLQAGARVTLQQQRASLPTVKRVRVDILRPTGFSAASVELGS